MFKGSLFPILIAIFSVCAVSVAEAKPGAPGQFYACIKPVAKSSAMALTQPKAVFQRVRDSRAAASGGGRGGAGGCWSACFSDYNDCVDVGPKDVCVSRMKTCLAICDRLSNRPGM